MCSKYKTIHLIGIIHTKNDIFYSVLETFSYLKSSSDQIWVPDAHQETDTVMIMLYSLGRERRIYEEYDKCIQTVVYML